MSTKTVKIADVPVVPFFARFLEAQSTDGEGTETPAPPSFPWTFKFPSDFEDA
ncbi:MAG: microviridin/marinostatin family tricyclic proteinase inhibitor [Nostoc sp. TH1S01]|nr:microviridin/marinostatin family tricyclic proteinase inhibitor [Nostoc sp. TH1S01]